MPPRAVEKNKAKREHQNRLQTDLAEQTFDRIGGTNRVADIINEGLQSVSPQTRNKALNAVLDLAKVRSDPDEPVEDMGDEEIGEELEVYVGRILVNMSNADFEPFLQSVLARRSAREEGLKKVAKARAKKENPPAEADSFLLPPVE